MSTSPADDAILTGAEVARWLKISSRQVRRLVGLPYVDCGERSRRYRRSDVLAWLAAQRRSTRSSRDA